VGNLLLLFLIFYLFFGAITLIIIALQERKTLMRDISKASVLKMIYRSLRIVFLWYFLLILSVLE